VRQGGGFAVVAGEVKQLAQSTTDATTEIEATIARMRLGLDHLSNQSGGTSGKAQIANENASSFTDILNMRHVQRFVAKIDQFFKRTGFIQHAVAIHC